MRFASAKRETRYMTFYGSPASGYHAEEVNEYIVDQERAGFQVESIQTWPSPHSDHVTTVIVFVKSTLITEEVPNEPIFPLPGQLE